MLALIELKTRMNNEVALIGFAREGSMDSLWRLVEAQREKDFVN
jgi:hypothetical protein